MTNDLTVYLPNVAWNPLSDHCKCSYIKIIKTQSRDAIFYIVEGKAIFLFLKCPLSPSPVPPGTLPPPLPTLLPTFRVEKKKEE